MASEHTHISDVKIRRGMSRADVGGFEPVEIDLVAAVLAMIDDEPVVLMGEAPTHATAEPGTLPTTVFTPSHHVTLESAARQSLVTAGNLDAGHLEQLSSYCGEKRSGANQRCALSIGYLALVRADQLMHVPSAHWLRLYDVFPWEDWRQGRPVSLIESIEPALPLWQADTDATQTEVRASRLRIAFGLGESSWDDERVVERLELLEEARLLPHVSPLNIDPTHRRILAAALGRLRARVRHRPVVFEMLPEQFTLFELQRAVEAILGPHLHKQNFRRLVEGMGLVEPTGDVRSHTGGRPARLFRFRPAVMLERAAPGVRIRPGKVA